MTATSIDGKGAKTASAEGRAARETRQSVGRIGAASSDMEQHRCGHVLSGYAFG